MTFLERVSITVDQIGQQRRLYVGKRSNFERKPRDYYPTPIDAVIPLIKHLPKKGLFAEPCAGDGRL